MSARECLPACLANERRAKDERTKPPPPPPHPEKRKETPSERKRRGANERACVRRYGDEANERERIHGGRGWASKRSNEKGGREGRKERPQLDGLQATSAATVVYIGRCRCDADTALPVSRPAEPSKAATVRARVIEQSTLLLQEAR